MNLRCRVVRSQEGYHVQYKEWWWWVTHFEYGFHYNQKIVHVYATKDEAKKEAKALRQRYIDYHTPKPTLRMTEIERIS